MASGLILTVVLCPFLLLFVVTISSLQDNLENSAKFKVGDCDSETPIPINTPSRSLLYWERGGTLST